MAMNSARTNGDAPDEIAEDNPRLAGALERNIRTLNRLRREAEAKRNLQDRAADAITAFSGSMAFLYVHIAWFAVWIALNVHAFGTKPFDPFPFGLLTLIVSLEAIFLATFVLISQNRSAEQAERQSQLALQIGLITEHQVSRCLQMLDDIQDKLGIENDADDELRELEQTTSPEDVLEEIVRVNRRGRERNRGGK